GGGGVRVGGGGGRGWVGGGTGGIVGTTLAHVDGDAAARRAGAAPGPAQRAADRHVCGVLTGLICCLAVVQGSFLLFNVGAVFSGLYASAHQSYRFAAADTASEAFRPKAISWVLFGVVVAAV